MVQAKLKVLISVAVLAGASFFLFTRLGHAALWDDEANTALFALSVWRTGDTSALLDGNLVAHYSGAELVDLRNRYIPPLANYVSAPFVGLVGRTALAARLPFAVCGLLTVSVMLLWLWRDNPGGGTWWLMGAGILGNVSLMLYARQCRYYALAMLATTALAYLYCHRGERKRTMVLMAAVSLLLLGANYMSFAAAYVCLAVDYLLWGRKRRRLTLRGAAVLFVPQVVLGGLLVAVYNPIGKDIFGYQSQWWLLDRAKLLWWNVRELNGCELGVGVLIAAAPLLYFATRDRRLLRAPAAIAVYILTVALLSPQPLEPLLSVAFVRYLAPLIPLCILTGVLSIRAVVALLERRARLERGVSVAAGILLGAAAFGTNMLHGGPLAGADESTGFSRPIAEGRFRSTVLEFTAELIRPAPSTYRAAAGWIGRNVPERRSVWVVPGYATYPLMFHAPNALYAWQLNSNMPPDKAGQFEHLPRIHFMGSLPPDYVVVFGPAVQQVRHLMRQWQTQGIRYRQVRRIEGYWYDLSRPELFWHAFGPIEEFDRNTEGVYIFARSGN